MRITWSPVTLFMQDPWSKSKVMAGYLLKYSKTGVTALFTASAPRLHQGKGCEAFPANLVTAQVCSQRENKFVY